VTTLRSGGGRFLFLVTGTRAPLPYFGGRCRAAAAGLRLFHFVLLRLGRIVSKAPAADAVHSATIHQPGGKPVLFLFYCFECAGRRLVFRMLAPGRQSVSCFLSFLIAALPVSQSVPPCFTLSLDAP
jgi:hypothetical protein